MSAAKALNLARNKKTIIALEHHMRVNNIPSTYELARRVWGVDAKGIPRNIHRLYPVLNGKSGLSHEDATEIAAFFEIPVEDLIVQDNAASSAVAIYQPTPTQTRASRATPNEFTFTINSGRAAVALNLTDLDVQKAMQIVAALGAIGVIPGLPKNE